MIDDGFQFPDCCGAVAINIAKMPELLKRPQY
jgi:hypothetical protein